jgi:predicted aconitase
MPVALSDRDRAFLRGDHGEGAAFAMRLVLLAADALGAERLLDISGAHVDSCLFHGQATMDFVDRIATGGTQIAVPTTLNVGGVDLLHPELWRGTAAAAAQARRLMDAYRALGCRPTYTCAPYQTAWARPGLGEQVAWAESNAIVFCNSVLGARTERYGDFTDIACAVTGRAPDAGLHRTEARRATLVLRLADEVPAALRDADQLYPVLGTVLGRRAGSAVAALSGLPPGLSEDRLKAVGAAAASSGAVAMFHAVGSTPEAPTLAAATGGRDVSTEEIALDELRAARDALSTGRGMPLAAVSLGTPHASLAELRAIAAALDGQRPRVDLLVSTGRDVLAAAGEDGTVARLAASGVELLVDTCSYLAPTLRDTPGAVMTDSAKWAAYAPGNIGREVIFGGRNDCLASALAGRVVIDLAAWGGA